MRFNYYFIFNNNSYVKTANPQKDIWDYFLKISDVPFLKRTWPETKIETIKKVSTHIKQAYEYYISSRNVTLLTKPVLIYYSLHNLTKAFIELRGNEDDLNYHGLCNCEIGETILETKAYANDGVFQSLAKCFNYEFDKKEELLITDFIYNTVEGNKLLVDYYGLNSNFINVRWKGNYEGTVELELINWKNITDSYDNLSEIIINNTKLLNDFELFEENEKVCLRSKEKQQGSEMNKLANSLANKYCVYKINEEEPNWINIMKSDKKFCPSLGYYGISYILSSVVRYNPEAVEKYIKIPETSNEFFINKLLEYCERILPNLYINKITNMNLIYG
ncbi:YaaC family protein [Sediminispirochaeta smaragdinae]|uniref:Uncharacterized protein n=1 Tax=Sediminispirochaeta smaragdinae (strain DSM 11293 / JCM 15392 / SEBR 4228) TaxID=573413 RepID=E1RB25_SEDSS|nr:YaaC family protein [Sediminispirochaeta smaragdinae]ADK79555.1 hypothetical protein Spirs_0400 [Sediminispirochaeta smaragdinae DSM 11293]